MTRTPWTWTTTHDIRAVLPRILREPLGYAAIQPRVSAAVGCDVSERRIYRTLQWHRARGTVRHAGPRGHRVYARVAR